MTFETRQRQRVRAELWIPVAYALLGALYIWKSDAWVARLAPDLADAARWSTWKGWGFVALTAALLHLVLRRVLRRLAATATELFESEARYRTLVEEAPEAVLITDAERLLFGNRAAARLLGAPSAESLVGRPYTDFIDATDHAVVAARASAVVEGGSDGKVNVRRARRLDGTSFSAEIVSAQVRFAGRPAALVLTRDVTERERRQEAAGRLNGALRTLVAWDEVIATATKERELLDRFCQQAVDVGGFALAWIAWFGSEEAQPPRVVATAGRDDGYVAALLARWPEEVAENRRAAEDLRAGRPVIANAIASDLRLGARRDAALQRGLASFVVLPLGGTATQEPMGLVALYAKEPGAFDDAVEQVLAQGVRELSIGLASLRGRAVLTSLLDHAPAAIMVHDADGKLVMVNRFLAERVGRPPEELVGRGVRDALPALPSDWLRSSEAALAARAPVRAEESFERGGERLWFDVVKFPLLLDDEAPVDVGVIVTDVTTRRAAEELLERQREELRALAGELLTVREEEKARIARDLHDDLGQLLTRLKIDVRALERALDELAPAPTTAGLIDRAVAVSELVDETLARVRVIATELRPGTLDALGLGAALEQEVRAFAARTGIVCAVDVEGAAAEQRGDVATALFRIAQEAMTNVLRHARASRLAVSLGLDGPDLVLRVADDGVGVAVERAASGLGLVGIRERASALGGRAKVEPGATGGTVVSARIPFAG